MLNMNVRIFKVQFTAPNHNMIDQNQECIMNVFSEMVKYLKAALIKVESSGLCYFENLKMLLLATSKVRSRSTPPLSKVSVSAPVYPK